MSRDGSILQTFGGHSGPRPQQLDRPLHLAIDPPAGLLYVLDSGNKCLKVLNASSLELVDVILSTELANVDPRRIYLDTERRRLAVAVEDGRVFLFEC